MSESAPATPCEAASGWVALLPLCREIGDLKRLRTPELQPSISAVAFDTFARRIFINGGDWTGAAQAATAHAVAATRLAGIRPADLAAAGLDAETIADIFANALETHRGAIAAGQFDALSRTCIETLETPTRANRDWIARLNRQPRAGATAPGQPRWVLEPVESCGEHCHVTAIYSVLLAPFFGADPGEAFAISLAHHAHNADLPDAGFAGENLFGAHLVPAIDRLRNRVIAEIAPAAADRLRPLFTEIGGAETPLAQTFQTADTLDRVLQMEYFARVNRFELATALVDMDIVHEGPVQAYQKAQLQTAGLLP